MNGKTRPAALALLAAAALGTSLFFFSNLLSQAHSQTEAENARRQALAASAILAQADQAGQLAAVKAQSEANLRQIGLALAQYRREHDQREPPLQSAAQAQLVLRPYLISDPSAVFVSPMTRTRYKVNVASQPQSGDTVLFYEGGAASDGTRQALFASGRVQELTPAEWTRVKKEQSIPD